MAMLGMFWAALGLLALFDDAYRTVQTNELHAFTSLAPWGWAHLLGGLLAVVAGIGILWVPAGGRALRASSSPG